ncbi:MAG: hypothetical protein HPY55_09035 [Firmicutes bacterium]|nr:hypothetical protein [Bacillota bacterium]
MNTWRLDTVLALGGSFLSAYLLARLVPEALGGNRLSRLDQRRDRRASVPLARTLPWPGAVRRDRLEDQMEFLVVLISGGMKAGLSLVQALESAQEEVQDPPLGPGLRDSLNRYRMGARLIPCLLDLARCMDHPDFEYLVRVLEIYTSSGGDLSAALEGVSRTVRERRAMRDQIRAGCADARLSALIMAVLPMGFALYMLVARRDMLSLLGIHPLGRAGLAYAVVSWILGVVVTRRIAGVDDV